MKITTLILLVVSLFAHGVAAELVTGSVDLPVTSGKPIHFSLPTGWKATVAGTKLVLLPPQGSPHIQLWAVMQTSVADAVSALPATIEGEVKQFKPTAINDLTLAGGAAKHVLADGVEVDDGDEARVEAFVFTVGKQVVVACAHGEGPGAADRRTELTAILTTAAAP